MNNQVYGRILLILTGGDSADAEEAAFVYAKSTSRKLVVLQILTSNLYHYGHQDIIATRPSKRQFLLHIREEVLKRGKAKALAMVEKAEEEGIVLEILSVESEDIHSTASDEAMKGYDAVFVEKRKSKIFPLLERTLVRHLQKKIAGKVVEC